jgi:hypothetical protein
VYSKTGVSRAEQRERHEERTRQWSEKWLDAHRMMNWGVDPMRIVAHIEQMLVEFCSLTCLTCRTASGVPCRTLKSKVVTAPHRSRTVMT